MASDYPRFSKLSIENRQTPGVDYVPAPTATPSWQGTGYTQATQYYQLTSMRASQNATPVYEGESLPSSEYTLTGAANKQRPRLVVTLDSAANGFRIYKSGTTALEKLWADVHVTRDAAGSITGASLISPYDAGSIVSTTASTVTWDGPTGQDQGPSGGNPTVPTSNLAERYYLVMLDRLLLDAGSGWERVANVRQMADRSQAISDVAHRLSMRGRFVTTAAGAAADVRTLLGWAYIRFRPLPDTYPTKYHDCCLDVGTQQGILAAFTDGPKTWEIALRGVTPYSTPPDLFVP